MKLAASVSPAAFKPATSRFLSHGCSAMGSMLSGNRPLGLPSRRAGQGILDLGKQAPSPAETQASQPFFMGVLAADFGRHELTDDPVHLETLDGGCAPKPCGCCLTQEVALGFGLASRIEGCPCFNSYDSESPMTSRRPWFPSFKVRTDQDELMVDIPITDQRTHQLAARSTFASSIKTLGGYQRPDEISEPLLLQATDQRCGSSIRHGGSPTFPEYLVALAFRSDAPGRPPSASLRRCNPAPWSTARQALSPGGCPRLAALSIRVDVGRCPGAALPEQVFDCGASLRCFLHHFRPCKAVQVMEEHGAVGAPRNLIKRSCSRTPLAYAGHLWAHALAAGIRRLMQNDGPHSVLRGFEARGTQAIAKKPGSSTFRFNGAGLFSLATEHHPLKTGPL